MVFVAVGPFPHEPACPPDTAAPVLRHDETLDVSQAVQVWYTGR